MTEDAAFLTSVLAYIDDPKTVVALLTVLHSAKPIFIPTKALLSNVICSASEVHRKMLGSECVPALSINKKEADSMTYALDGSSLEVDSTFLRKLHHIIRYPLSIHLL